MNYSTLRKKTFLGAVFAAIALTTSLVSAQLNVQYRPVWPTLPHPFELTGIAQKDMAFATDVDGHASVVLVVGHYSRTDRVEESAFVYDHLGLLGIPGKFWDIYELIPELPAWVGTRTRTRLFGVNANGRVAGTVRSVGGSDTCSFYMDLLGSTVEMIEIPHFSTNPTSSGVEGVSNTGDILLTGRSADEPDGFQVSIFNPDSNKLTLVRKNSSEPMFFEAGTSSKNIFFNSSREIIGHTGSGVGWQGPTFKHVVPPDYATLPVDTNGVRLTYADSGETTVFANLLNSSGINEFGEIACTYEEQIRRNKFKYSAARVNANGRADWSISRDELDDLAGTQLRYQLTTGLNNNGDVYFRGNDLAYYMYEGDPTVQGDEAFVGDLHSLISDPNNEITVMGYLTDRDNTGFGWMLGKSSDGQSLVMLAPEIPGQPPGISVNTDNLTTAESGGTDSFDVVLDSEPTADVTIGISSSNTNEGTVDQASLTFTPANWDTPQTVTITGVDDPFGDGDVAYTIFTAAATSTDPDYDGLDADDVSVTNEDDDLPPGGGSETYGSDAANSDLEIPDNDPAGIDPPSTIGVGDHLITNLTVNVDITHQRSSDLDVYLVGPDGGPPVQLFNFSGDNNVADFNGESSLGLWTLEVYDTRKKRTGTLNSWSITVEH